MGLVKQFRNNRIEDSFLRNRQMSDVRQELIRDEEGDALGYRLHRANGLILEYGGEKLGFLDMDADSLKNYLPEEIGDKLNKPFLVLSNINPAAFKFPAGETFAIDPSVEFEAVSVDDALHVMAKHYAAYSEFESKHHPENEISADMHLLDFRTDAEQAIFISLSLNGPIKSPELAHEHLTKELAEKYKDEELMFITTKEKGEDKEIYALSDRSPGELLVTTHSEKEYDGVLKDLTENNLCVHLSPQEANEISLKPKRTKGDQDKALNQKKSALDKKIDDARERAGEGKTKADKEKEKNTWER